MKRKSDLPLQKVTMSLVEGDYDLLRGWFPRKGAAAVIRAIVHAYVRNLQSKLTRPIDSAELSDAEILKSLGGGDGQ